MGWVEAGLRVSLYPRKVGSTMMSRSGRLGLRLMMPSLVEHQRICLRGVLSVGWIVVHARSLSRLALQ